MIIDKILEKSPFESLTYEENDTLYKNRHALIGETQLFSKIIKSFNLGNNSCTKELEKFLNNCKPVPPMQAMQLLTGDYFNESVRKFAVFSMQQSSDIDNANYLTQFVQTLKYEVYHDSPLARYLLKIAIKNPLTLGHQFFWNLKSEMYNANVQQRYGLYLETFLNKIGHETRKIFEEEVWLINNLLRISEIAKSHKLTKENINEELKSELTKLNEEINGREISIPLNFKLRIKGIIVDKCKFMKSKKKPLWLVFVNADSLGENINVMFKKGDDLRQDVITLQLMKIMNNLWFNEEIKLKMSLYNVVCTGFFNGMIEIVTQSETLATIQKEYGGLVKGFSQKPLKSWMEKNITNISEFEYVNNFLLSCVAYCVATFVLGIGDRHNDNIMVKKVINEYIFI